MNQNRPAFPRVLRVAGFTLAETLVAIGIVSFTLLVMIGLMPPGLENLRQAEARAARARIYTTLAGEYEAMGWDAISQQRKGSDSPIWFDHTGLRTNDRNQAAYAAMIKVLPQSTSGDDSLPGTAAESPYLRRIEIKVSSKPFSQRPFDTDEPDVLESRNLMVVKTEADEGSLEE